MTATEAVPPPTRRGGGRWGWVLGVAVGVGLVAHGCHGADVDHEPGAGVEAADGQERPAGVGRPSRERERAGRPLS